VRGRKPFSLAQERTFVSLAVIEQAKKKAEAAARQYLGAEQPQPVKWVKTV